MKKILIYIIVGLLPVFISAQSSKYAAEFMELGVGSRALSMGSAYVGLSNDVTAYHWNPAGLAFLPNFQASSMYATLFNQLEQQSYVGVALPVFGGASVSLSWMRLSVDDIPIYEFDNNDLIKAVDRVFYGGTKLTAAPAGYFSSHSDAFVITFAKYLRLNWDLGWQYFELPVDLGFGLNLKLLQQSIDDRSGSGMGLDLGFISRIGLNEIFSDIDYGDIAFGLNVQDLTQTQITWDTDSKHKDRVPYNVKYGISYVQPVSSLRSSFTIAFDLNTRYNGTAHVGGEFLYHSMMAVRMGMNAGFFTSGAGFYLWKFRVDYAYQGHDLGNTHRVSILIGL